MVKRKRRVPTLRDLRRLFRDGATTVAEGAANWVCIASLIETCKFNGVDPFAYLVATLEAIAAGHPQSRIDDLTPWAFAAASSSNP